MVASVAACQRVVPDRLFALKAAGPESEVVLALPLALKAGGGNVSGGSRFGDLEVDTDAVHKVSASCHHGPPIANPLPLEVRASWDERQLHVEVTWRDPTPDRAPRTWERSGGEWRLGEADEDGVAILWSRGGGRYGCQEACHMSDFAVREGSVVDLRAMRLVEEGAVDEAWIWKSATGARELFLGNEGFVTISRGEIFRRPNSAVAADESLSPAARRAGTFGPGDGPVRDAEGKPLPPAAAGAPAWLHAGPAADGLLAARAERQSRAWRVTFSRPLEAGPGRPAFRPGERYRFGLALFDGTSTDHHLVRDAQVLELVVPAAGARTRGGDAEGIL